MALKKEILVCEYKFQYKPYCENQIEETKKYCKEHEIEMCGKRKEGHVWHLTDTYYEFEWEGDEEQGTNNDYCWNLNRSYVYECENCPAIRQKWGTQYAIKNAKINEYITDLESINSMLIEYPGFAEEFVNLVKKYEQIE